MPQNIRDLLSAPIPLSVVMFLIVQTMIFVWWVSLQVNAMNLSAERLDARLRHVETVQERRTEFGDRILILEQRADRQREEMIEIKNTLHSMEAAIDGLDTDSIRSPHQQAIP